jgi:hypothetical protein
MEKIEENLYITEWIHGFCSVHKLYGISVSILTDEKIKDIVNEYGLKTSKSKTNDNEYFRMRLADNCRFYDEKKQAVQVKDIEDLFRKNEVRMIIQTREFTFNEKVGTSVKIKQIQFKPKNDRFSKCFF